MKNDSNQRDAKWTESIAVGGKEFVMETKAKLGAKAIGRGEVENNEGYELKKGYQGQIFDFDISFFIKIIRQFQRSDPFSYIPFHLALSIASNSFKSKTCTATVSV